MNWINKLNQSSKEDWIEQIKKENTIPYEDLKYHQLFDQIDGLSFASYEDLPVEGLNFTLPNKNINWKIGSSIITSNLSQCKLLLDHALTHGAEYINLNASIISTEQDYSFLTKLVFTKMVTMNFEFSSTKISELNKLSKLIDSTVCISLSSANSIIKNQIKDLNNLQFITTYTFPVLHLSHWPQHLSNLLVDSQKVKNNIFRVQILFSHDFLNNIAAFRAIQKTILNNNFSAQFEIAIDPEIISIDPHQNLISFSSIALAASLCGPDMITLPPYNALEVNELTDNLNQTKDWLKTSLHLQHLLKTESYLNQINDPVAGSYYIEDLSTKIYHFINANL